MAGSRQRELLALLLLEAGRVVSTDRLMDELWGEHQPAAGATALRVRVSQLRKALRAGGELIVTRPPGYALLRAARRARPVALRARPRARASGRCAPIRSAPSTHSPGRSAEWRGAPLVDVAYAPFAQAADRAPRGAARVGARAADRGRARARPPRAADRRAAGPRRRAPAARAAVGAADDGALPRRPPGRRARGLPRRARAAGRGDRHRARARSCARSRRGSSRRTRPRGRSDADVAPGPRRAGGLHGRQRARRRGRAAGGGLGGRGRGGRRSSRDARSARRGDGRLRAAAPDAASPHSRPRPPARTPCGSRPSRTPRSCCSPRPTQGGIDAGTATVLRAAACDVAIVCRAHRGARRRRPGPRALLRQRHDWAAAELGRLARRRRASRCSASRGRAAPARRQPPARQRVARAAARRRGGEPRRAGRPRRGRGARGGRRGPRRVVTGLSERWQREGLGTARTQLLREAPCPVLLVRRGVGPGALAPPEALTRFSWSGGG